MNYIRKILFGLIKKAAIVCLVFFCYTCLQAQTPAIDSIKRLLKQPQAPAQKATLLVALLKEDESLDAPGEWMYCNQLYTIGTALNKDDLLWRALFYKVKYYQKIAKLQEASDLCDSAIANITGTPLQKEFYPMFANTKSFVLTKQNKFKDALALNFEVLRYAEQINDTLYQMRIKNGIGLIHMEMGQNRDAITWFLNSLRTTHNPDYLQKAIPVYSNLAANYSTLHQNDSALYYIRKSLNLATAAQNFDYLANAYFIASAIYIDQKNFPPAEQAMLKGLYYRKQVGDPFFVVSDLTEMGVFYAQSGQPEKGIAVCLSGIDSARKYNLDEKLPILYDALAQNYKAQKNYQKYADVLQEIVVLKDSVYKKASAEAVAELQTKYNLQKKETIITQQQLALVRKNYLVYGSAVLLLVLLIAALLVFKNYRKRQQLKLQLVQEEEARRSEKAVAKAEEAERKRIAADLHDSLGAYAASIASNIYQLEQVPDEKNNSVLHELHANSQAIVSQLSDTIWVLKKDVLLLTAISDRVKLFIQKLASSHPGVSMDVWEVITTDYLLLPAQAFHLFQIIKEAIINALKHSHCTQVTVKMEGHDGWKVTITDNGRGFPAENIVAQSGNGLGNMKERAQESGWTIAWQAAQPAGTRVLIAPTTN